MNKYENHVEEMVAKAAQSAKADDAMKFSQAACNAANALSVLDHIRGGGKIPK